MTSRFKDRARRAQDRRLPVGVEDLEPRHLQSVLPVLAARAPRPVPTLMATLSGAANPNVTTAPEPPVRALPFLASGQGPFQSGHGRLVGPETQTLISGETTSNFFLHGPFAMVFFTPADPTQTITGKAALYDRTNPNFGTQVVLDLTAAPQDRNALGLPTRMAWTVSDGSGIFTNATGQGTVVIHYRPGGPQAPGVALAGRAAVVFRGEINIPVTAQIFNTQRLFA